MNKEPGEGIRKPEDYVWAVVLRTGHEIIDVIQVRGYDSEHKTIEKMNDAVITFTETEACRELVRKSKRGFNWVDAIKEVPESIWRAHGLVIVSKGVEGRVFGLRATDLFMNGEGRLV